MDGVNNIILNEICWIVQRRNEWAKRRQHYRNKIYRSKYVRGPKLSQEEFATLAAKYKQVNGERLSLNVHTKRLRTLLKKVDGLLHSDKNAGYGAVAVGVNGDILGYKIIRRDEITARAKEHEVDLYMASMFKGA
jgi:hypothetical protein